MYKVLICGDRQWSDIRPIEREVLKLKKEHKDVLIITGGAAGADAIAELVGTRNDCHVAVVKALWNTRHRGAGPQRNSAMLALRPDECLAFHPDISKSKGTRDMVNRAMKANLPVIVIKR